MLFGGHGLGYTITPCLFFILRRIFEKIQEDMILNPLYYCNMNCHKNALFSGDSARFCC